MPARATQEVRQTSLRIPTATLAWVKAESERRGGIAHATIINEALENAKTLYHSAPQAIELLDRTAAKLGLTRTEHMQYILSDYTTRLVVQEAQAAIASEKAPVSPDNRKKK